ncbi:MAG TPA: SCO family protein [Acidobacteriota bacterium]|nr:SCO family protein [Acidobacteriota bacterium]
MRSSAFPTLLLTLCLSAAALQAQTHQHHHPGADEASQEAQCHDPAQTDEATEAVKAPAFPDVELLDQRGRRVHFFSDLIQGRTVAVQTIFTTCTTICPPMGAHFAKLQKKLGPDSEVQLISVSIDPVTDRPSRLRAWQARFGARGDNWTLVTGSKLEVDRLLRSLGLFSPDKVDHSPTILVGNEASGQWTRTNGLADPDKLLEILAQLQEAPSTR